MTSSASPTNWTISELAHKGHHLPPFVPYTSISSPPEPTMRKIETLMNQAISEGRNFSSGNTTVTHEGDVAIVHLHGNKIAEIDDSSVTLFDGGWQTATTKSRINAICSVHCIKGEGVFQRNSKWFVHQFAGQAGTSSVFVEKEFVNGFIFA